MSVVVAGGEKLVETPSVSGESVVEVQPFPPMKDQVVVRGERLRVPMKPPTPFLKIRKAPIHDPLARVPRSFVAVSGSAVPPPPVAKTAIMPEVVIHDSAERPSFVVNLGDVDGPPAPPRPRLGPTPISVAGPRREAPVRVEHHYSGPEAVIHGVPQDEEDIQSPEALVFIHPPVEAKIHDPGQRAAL